MTMKLCCLKVITIVAIGWSRFAKGADQSAEQLFDGAARLDGDAYFAARGTLEQRGMELLPILRQKLNSKDWRESDLAGDLLFRIEKPAETKLLIQALSHRPHIIGFKDGHLIEVQFDKSAWDDADFARTHGNVRVEAPDSPGVTITRSHVPVLLGLIRAELSNISSNYNGSFNLKRCLQILKHLAAPESVPLLAHFCGAGFSEHPLALDAMTAVGPSVAPFLRNVVQSAPDTFAGPGSRLSSWDVDLQKVRSAAAAARVLARLQDRECVPLLLDKLKQAAFGQAIEAYSAALSELQVTEAIPLIFENQPTIGAGRKTSNEGHWPSYLPMRAAVLAFGDKARPFLRERLDARFSLAERAAGMGMLWELDNPAEADMFYSQIGTAVLDYQKAQNRGAPAEQPLSASQLGRQALITGWSPPNPLPIPDALQIERAYHMHRFEDLMLTVRQKNQPLSFEVVADALFKEHWYHGEGDKLIIALVEMGDERVIAVLEKLLATASASYSSTCVEALMLFGSAKAVPVLEGVIERDEKEAAEQAQGYGRNRYLQRAAELARAFLPALKGDKQHLLKLLSDPDKLDAAEKRPPQDAGGESQVQSSIRIVIARVLARTGELKALDVLIPAAAAANGVEHVTLRDAILSLGIAAIPQIERRQNASADSREKLVCECLLLRLRNANLVQRVEQARIHSSGFGNHAGPSTKDFQNVGRDYAKVGGKEAVPLFEAAVAFNTNLPSRDTALFALSALKEDRSIPVIVAAAGMAQPRGERVGNLFAIALGEFGEKGTEAAKAIPAPRPALPNFESRGARHETAAETLAFANKAEGIEKIIEGLREPRPAGDQVHPWLQRMDAYITAAKNYHDPRVLDAILAFAERQKDEKYWRWEKALAVIADYDDPRVIPICVRYLGEEEHPGAALAALETRLGEDIVPFLIKELSGDQIGKIRGGAALALAELANRKSYDPKPEKREEARLAAAKIRETAMVPLADALKASPSPGIASAMAAIAKDEHEHYDPRAVKALIEWLRTQPLEVPWQVAEVLGGSNDPDAISPLLKRLRSATSPDYQTATVLAKLHSTEGLSDLTETLRKRIADKDFKYGIPELRVMGEFGPPGLARILETFRGSKDMFVRLNAVNVLGEKGYREGFADVRDFCEELRAGGPWLPGLSKLPPDWNGDAFNGSVSMTVDTLMKMDPSQTYPYVCGLLQEPSFDKELLNRFGFLIRLMLDKNPELKNLPVRTLTQQPAIPGVAANDLAKIACLEACDSWIDATRDNDNDITEADRKRLLAAGSQALAALVDISYPPDPPDEKGIIEALARLEDVDTRDAAIRVLAFCPYSASTFRKALGSMKGNSLAYGTAILKWREKGPWTLRLHSRIMYAGTTVLERHWPVDEMRQFAKANLERLARIKVDETNWGGRPISPLLASLRYSQNAADRELLADFVKKATPTAADVARHIMADGLVGRTDGLMPQYWKTLPEHHYQGQ